MIYNSYPKTFTAPEGAVKFKMVIHGKGLADLSAINIQLNSGVNVAPNLSGEIAISSQWGNALVYCKDEIKQSDNQIIMPLYEPIWTQPLSAGVPTGGNGFTINGYNVYKDFGMIISEVNDFNNISKRIEVDTTDFYKKSQYREDGTINLIGFFESNLNGTLKENINKFYALMSSEGAKLFVIPGIKTFYVYAADGCQVSDIRDNYASFKMTLKITV